MCQWKVLYDLNTKSYVWGKSNTTNHWVPFFILSSMVVAASCYVYACHRQGLGSFFRDQIKVYLSGASNSTALAGKCPFTPHSNSSQTISIWLRSGEVVGQVIWCSTPSLLLCQIALTQPEGVFGHCPVEKQMMVSLRANQMGWRIAAECCGSHAG